MIINTTNLSRYIIVLLSIIFLVSVVSSFSVNIPIPQLFGNGSNITNYYNITGLNQSIADTLYYSLSNPYGYYNSTTLPSSGGGNPFDQSLNTTDNVIFNTVNATAFYQNGNQVIDTSNIGSHAVVTETDPIYSANTYATSMNQGVATGDNVAFNTVNSTTFYGNYLQLTNNIQSPINSNLIDMNSGSLSDSQQSVGWSNRYLYDSGGTPSVDWNNRELKDFQGNKIASWYGNSLQDVNGNPYLTTGATGNFVDGVNYWSPTTLTNNNQLSNGAGYLTSFSESDPVFTTWKGGANIVAGTGATDSGGSQDVAIGYYATAGATSGNDGVAIGSFSSSSGLSTAVGHSSNAWGLASTALGLGTTTSQYSLAVGQYATAAGSYGTNIGSYDSHGGSLTNPTDYSMILGGFNGAADNIWLLLNDTGIYDRNNNPYLTSATVGSYITSGEPLWDANSSTVARIGNCPAGQVVQNTTTGGVQCVVITTTESDPLWTGNSTLVGYLASNNKWTNNQNLTGNNITNINYLNPSGTQLNTGGNLTIGTYLILKDSGGSCSRLPSGTFCHNSTGTGIQF